MIKRVITSLVTLMLFVSSSTAIFAQEERNELTIDESDDYVTKLEFDGNGGFVSTNTYIGDELIYSSYYKSDGNVYLLVDGIELLAINVEEVPYDNLNNDKALNSVQRAPSQFILKNSGYILKVKVTNEVIEQGKQAISNTLKTLLKNYIYTGGNTYVAFTAAGITAIEELAGLIKSSYSEFNTNVTRNYYVYNGCDWLLYSEFVFTQGYTVGGYSWADNPSLGIASYTCKVASQKYPY